MDVSATFTEVVALVVGILVALWVNNWNQRRLDRRRAHSYIASLRVDVASDVEALEHQVEYAEGTAEAAKSLLRAIRGEAALPDANTTLRMLKRAGTMYPFRPTKTTYQELAGGGNLSIIEDRELLRAVISYYGATDFAQEASALAIRRIWLEYYDALARSIDPTLIPSMTLDIIHLIREGGPLSPSEATSDRALPSLDLRQRHFDPSALRNAEDLERALAMVLDSSVFVRETLRDLRMAAEGLLEVLDQGTGNALATKGLLGRE